MISGVMLMFTFRNSEFLCETSSEKMVSSLLILLAMSSQSHPPTGRLLGGKFPGSPSYFPSIFTKLQHFFPPCSPISYHFPTVPNDFPAGFCVSEVDASCAARSNCTRHLGYHGGSRHRCGSVSLEKWWFETTISWEFIVDIADL